MVKSSIDNDASLSWNILDLIKSEENCLTKFVCKTTSLWCYSRDIRLYAGTCSFYDVFINVVFMIYAAVRTFIFLVWIKHISIFIFVESDVFFNSSSKGYLQVKINDKVFINVKIKATASSNQTYYSSSSSKKSRDVRLIRDSWGGELRIATTKGKTRARCFALHY